MIALDEIYVSDVGIRLFLKIDHFSRNVDPTFFSVCALQISLANRRSYPLELNTPN